MSITTDLDTDDVVKIQDASSGLIAKVSPKTTTGENAVHTIAETTISSVGAGNIFCWPSDLKYRDMNVSTGGVARGTSIGTSYVTIYNESGSGLLIGFQATLRSFSSKWQIKLTVDSDVVFEFLSDDLTSPAVYNLDVASNNSFTTMFGLKIDGSTFRWQAPIGFPMCYESFVKFEVRRTTSPMQPFYGGLVSITGV